MTMPGGAEIAFSDAPVISVRPPLAFRYPAGICGRRERGRSTFCCISRKPRAKPFRCIWPSIVRRACSGSRSAGCVPAGARAHKIFPISTGRDYLRPLYRPLARAILFPGREVRRIVLLRDPLQLHLSFYNWKMMDHLAKGWGTYSFSLHLRALPRNFIAHFLLSRWVELSSAQIDGDVRQRENINILNNALAGFWFVGAHSDCDRVIAAIGADLRVPPVAAPRNTSADAAGSYRMAAGDRTVAVAVDPRRDPGEKSPRLRFVGELGRGRVRTGKVRPAALERATEHDGFGPRGDSPLVPAAPLCPPRMGRAPAPAPGRSIAPTALATRATGNSPRRHYRDALRAIPKASAIWVQYGHALKEAGTCRRGGTGLSAVLAAQSRQRRYPFAARPRTQAATAIRRGGERLSAGGEARSDIRARPQRTDRSRLAGAAYRRRGPRIRARTGDYRRRFGGGLIVAGFVLSRANTKGRNGFANASTATRILPHSPQ